MGKLLFFFLSSIFCFPGRSSHLEEWPSTVLQTVCNTALFAWHAVATVWHQTLLPLIPTRAVRLCVCLLQARTATWSASSAASPHHRTWCWCTCTSVCSPSGPTSRRCPPWTPHSPTARSRGRPTRCLTERHSLEEMDRQERGNAYLMFDWTPLTGGNGQTGEGAGLPDVWLNAAHWRKWTDRRGGRPTRCLTEYRSSQWMKDIMDRQIQWLTCELSAGSTKW